MIERSQVRLPSAMLYNKNRQVVQSCASVSHQAVQFGTGQETGCSLAGKVTADLAESNGSIPPGL